VHTLCQQERCRIAKRTLHAKSIAYQRMCTHQWISPFEAMPPSATTVTVQPMQSRANNGNLIDITYMSNAVQRQHSERLAGAVVGASINTFLWRDRL